MKETSYVTRSAADVIAACDRFAERRTKWIDEQRERLIEMKLAATRWSWRRLRRVPLCETRHDAITLLQERFSYGLSEWRDVEMWGRNQASAVEELRVQAVAANDGPVYLCTEHINAIARDLA